MTFKTSLVIQAVLVTVRHVYDAGGKHNDDVGGGSCCIYNRYNHLNCSTYDKTPNILHYTMYYNASCCITAVEV